MDKIERLLDAMEHPEHYTLSEIETMLKDPEAKEVFDLFDKTKSSLQTIVVPDIEDEWKRFEKERHNHVNNVFYWFAALFSRNAAATIAVGIASLTAVAALVGVGIRHFNDNRETTAKEIEVVSESDANSAQSDTITLIEEDNATAVEIIVFDNEPLETILNNIAGYYGCKVTFNDRASKSLRLYFRWNQALAVEEVVERLNNFEQIQLTVKDKTIKVD